MAEAGRRRWLELGFTAAVAAGALWAGWGAWHDRRLAAGFERVNLGMDRAAAEAVLGRPDWEGACGTWVKTLPREDCARELGYASAFALIIPSYYMIQLDRGGRVIEAEPVPSP